MCFYCNHFNYNVYNYPIRAGKNLDFIDTKPEPNFYLFAAPYPINNSVLEHSSSSHSGQVFVKFVCSGLRDGSGLDYSELQKSEITCTLTSQNKNLDLVRYNLSKKLKCERILGPFLTPLTSIFESLPFGIVLKKTPVKF